MGEPATNLRISREYGEKMPVEQLVAADTTRHDTYDRKITPEERASYGESVIQLSQEVEDVTEQKKATVKQLGDDIKKAAAERRSVLKTLKKGTVEQADMIHVFYDYQESRVYEYNSLGERTGNRRMRTEERQQRIPTGE